MILQADARHIPLRDGCVQTVVTSPPYWGLRDYGTARWKGGDEDCDHSTPRSKGDDIRPGDKQGTSAGSRPNTQHECYCGARRIDLQIGLEPTPAEYVATMVEVFREVRRVLRDDGTAWLNLGDSYAANRGYQVPDSKWVNVGNSRGMKADALGLKPKDLCMIPARVALALQADGWWLRSDIVWNKPNPMPESVTDRPTRSHEYIFLLSKSERYFYDADAIREDVGIPTRRSASFRSGGSYTQGRSFDNSRIWPNETHGDGELSLEGRNKRSVWTVNSEPTPEAHFATFPKKLTEPCILAGSRDGDLVLDPFVGSGTVGEVAERFGRRWVGLELSTEYIMAIARYRTAQRGIMFGAQA